MSSAREVHYAKMNVGIHTNEEVEEWYQETLAKIEEYERKIEHCREILGVLEAQHVRRAERAKLASEAS